MDSSFSIEAPLNATGESANSSVVSTRSQFQETIINQLCEVLNQYLEKHPHLTLNGLSKKSKVSEPTLRRISKKQIKTLPTVSTVLDILTLISKKREVREIVEQFEGPLGDYLKQAFPQLESLPAEYSSDLNEELQNPTKYLIFKLSLNRSGVSRQKVQQLFGDLGLMELDSLVRKKIVIETENFYRAGVRNYSGSYDQFIDHFRATAAFLKVDQVIPLGSHNPLFVNGSESINLDAYQEIIKIQKTALKKISQVLADPKSHGSLPVFYLLAFDTLDSHAAHQWNENK